MEGTVLFSSNERDTTAILSSASGPKMAFTLYSLIEAAILFLNAVCVLHEERFLSKIGWGSDQRGFGEEPGMKAQLIHLIRSIRTVMRIPLIGVNVVVIALKLVFG